MASPFFSPISLVCSSICLFHVIFGRPRPLFPATSKSNGLFKTSPLSLLKTCPCHRTSLALASPSPSCRTYHMYQLYSFEPRTITLVFLGFILSLLLSNASFHFKNFSFQFSIFALIKTKSSTYKISFINPSLVFAENTSTASAKSSGDNTDF